MKHDLHILRAGVKYLGHALVGHEFGQGRQVVDHQRIDRDALGRGGNLNQAQARVERALAQKLGIDGNRVELEGALTKVEQSLMCGNVHINPSNKVRPEKHG